MNTANQANRTAATRTLNLSALRTLLTAGLIALGATVALAQYTGPVEGKKGDAPLRTVAEIREHNKDDQPVVLTGVLAKKLGKDKYLFKDDTGEIRVEIDAEDFPTVEVSEKTRVEITGEVDKSALRAAEVDAKRVRVLP